MGIIKKLKSKNVFLDTAPLIYYIEENSKYLSLLNKLFLANSNGEFLFQTSVIRYSKFWFTPCVKMNNN